MLLYCLLSVSGCSYRRQTAVQYRLNSILTIRMKMKMIEIQNLEIVKVYFVQEEMFMYMFCGIILHSVKHFSRKRNTFHSQQQLLLILCVIFFFFNFFVSLLKLKWIFFIRFFLSHYYFYFLNFSLFTKFFFSRSSLL